MKASLIKEALLKLVAIKQPTFTWGPPGIGKSDVIKQVAKEMKLELIDIRTVLMDPVDLRGIPHVNGDNLAHWCPPAFLPREGKGILFFDEMNAAPPLVQASCYQIVLDRKLGEYELPEGWSVLAAGNRETDRAVTHRMPSALANRFVHLDFQVDVDDWVSWALNNGVRTEIIAFIKFRPDLLHQFDPTKNEKAFPTPRSWEFISKVLDSGLSKDLEFDVYGGTIGEGAASELYGFLKIFRSLPNPDHILMDPRNAEVPDKVEVLWAICVALTRKASEQTIENIVTYANRLPDEFSVKLIHGITRENSDLLATRAVMEWHAEHSHVLV